MKNRLMPFQGWRLTFFQAVIFAVFALFSIRLYELQIVQFDIFETRANENRLSALPLAASRGAIRDRYDVRLAFNVPAYNVTIIPASLPEDREAELTIFNRLSALVDVPPTREIALRSSESERVRSIEELVSEGEGIAPFRPVIIAQDVPLEVTMQILEERIYMPGVEIDPIGVREYPTGASTSHVVGYMGPIGADEAEELAEQGYNPAYDRIGYEGVERLLENVLGGTRGSRLREVDVAGAVQQVISETPPIPGKSVRLAIDVELQKIAEASLLKYIQVRNTTPISSDKGLSNQGVAIAMNPQTGEVLALVSLPTYDNSRFARAIDGEYYLEIAADPFRPLVNNSIKGLYPPGSVWKLISASGVAEEDVIDPNTELADEGIIYVPNRYAENDQSASQPFVCWIRAPGHGPVDFVKSIAWSCDVYFYQVGGGNPKLSAQVLKPDGLDIDGLFRYATATGIGSELGIELPFEAAGRMPDREWKRRNEGENWSTGDTYNASFGQGYVTVTPLQLITQVVSIINDGTLYQPTVILDFLDEEGNILTPFAPKVLRTVNPDLVPPNQPLTLLLLEDMLMKGQTSLACICEEDSEFYDGNRCDPKGYRNTVNVSSDPFIQDPREYQVFIPLNYTFNASVCQPIRFPNVRAPYSPAFIHSDSMELVREGMRAAAMMNGGTSRAAILSGELAGIPVAGKTGTAEYCDNIANPLGYCVPGQWPAHAWYIGYAPYYNTALDKYNGGQVYDKYPPEIIIVAFVYNGGEGSRIALPVVREIMTGYFELKKQRTGIESLPLYPNVEVPAP